MAGGKAPEPAWPRVRWIEDGTQREACWYSARGAPAPRRLRVVDDRTDADAAYGDACQGTGLLWRGDHRNARQLLAALSRRAARHGAHRVDPRATPPGSSAMAQAFHRERQARAQRARTLGMLLVELDAAARLVGQRSAPEVAGAVADALGSSAFGPASPPLLMSLRELQGMVGAWQWRLQGIDVPAAGGRIHPHYGVFAPVRAEYVHLVATAPLPAALAAQDFAVDVGTGTGVLAAVLARRGVGRVLATDREPRALDCARENLARLGLAARVEVRAADLFPTGRAALAVCNPPWLPGRPGSPLEHAIYDPDSRMLQGFLHGLVAHLAEGGEGWLILSDLAERLGLRTRAELLGRIEASGLHVVDRLEARPVHPRSRDEEDPFHAVRSAEVTSLWRLAARRRT
ncbi:MAG: class I SAM-dependent methyltransferase [Steroidobacteraceae bacterium]|jgi:SAM-dependent methyltransferase|nr:class I SAM-dependent methyltransferase [Steroidobacteraceae bacterium]